MWAVQVTFDHEPGRPVLYESYYRAVDDVLAFLIGKPIVYGGRRMHTGFGTEGTDGFGESTAFAPGFIPEDYDYQISDNHWLTIWWVRPPKDAGEEQRWTV